MVFFSLSISRRAQKQLPQRENNGRKFGPSSSTSMKRKFFLSRAAAIIRGGWGPIWAEKIKDLSELYRQKCRLRFFPFSSQETKILNIFEFEENTIPVLSVNLTGLRLKRSGRWHYVCK